jgi:hypothetical protein
MPNKEPMAIEPEEPTTTQPETTEDEDVEGHMMLPSDPSSARAIAGARESEIRRSLQKHDLEADRRPHKRER